MCFAHLSSLIRLHYLLRLHAFLTLCTCRQLVWGIVSVAPCLHYLILTRLVSKPENNRKLIEKQQPAIWTDMFYKSTNIKEFQLPFSFVLSKTFAFV
jgi:hypothetical protein